MSIVIGGGAAAGIALMGQQSAEDILAASMGGDLSAADVTEGARQLAVLGIPVEQAGLIIALVLMVNRYQPTLHMWNETANDWIRGKLKLPPRNGAAE